MKPKRVEIIEEQVLFRKLFFTIKEAHLRHELYSGKMSQELRRLNFERGDSAAVLIHDPDEDSVVFTEQFRYPTYPKGPGWLLEIPAGTVEAEETDNPQVMLKRELMEDIGYDISKFTKICTFYVSPGGTSERIHLFYATASAKHKVGEGGGLVSEGEDIRVVTMKLDEAFKKIDSGEIVDAKTIIGLQWLKMKQMQKLMPA
jgi:nudix-type nucleoside diphosphatase (YffH/AdpP family)